MMSTTPRVGRLRQLLETLLDPTVELFCASFRGSGAVLTGYLKATCEDMSAKDVDRALASPIDQVGPQPIAIMLSASIHR